MNLFYLDYDLEQCAQYHCNAHCIKIILEAAQCISTARTINSLSSPYKPTHINHPTNIWVRSSRNNYLWTCNYAKALCREYTFRYQKRHKCEDYIDTFILEVPDLPDVGITDFYLAMPEHCKLKDPVLSYRNYYNIEKRHLMFGEYFLAGWKNRPVPYWISI